LRRAWEQVDAEHDVHLHVRRVVGPPAEPPADPPAAVRTAAGGERVRVVHDLGAVAAGWEELAGRLAAPPFLRPGWVTCWWEAFGRGTLEIHLLERGGRLAALVPLVRRRGALLGAMNCHTPELGLLAEDPAAAAALGRAVFAAAPHRVWIAALDPDGQALAAVRRGAGEAGYRVAVRPYQSAPYLPIEGRWSDYRAGLSANLAKDLRRSRRRLDRQGEVAVEIADGRQRLDGLLAEAFAVEAAGWKGRRGTAIRSRPETRLFYTEVARWAAREGMLRLLFLRLDGRPICCSTPRSATASRPAWGGSSCTATPSPTSSAGPARWSSGSSSKPSPARPPGGSRGPSGAGAGGPPGGCSDVPTPPTGPRPASTIDPPNPR
jgi:CelD/BcsL family acetyltransferase involved in cellulose biosynthesis